MKKIIVFIFLLVVVSTCGLKIFKTPDAFNNFENVKVSFFVNKGENAVPAYAKVEPNGIGEKITCDLKLAGMLEKSLANVKGTLFRFSGSSQIFESLINDLNVQKLKLENYGDIISCYGFVKNQSKCVFMEGKKVNIQLVYKDGKISVGYPIILGSY